LPAETTKNFVTTSVNHTTGDNDELGFVDATTGECVGMVGGKPYGEPGSFIRGGRESFRTLLWGANNLRVSADKEFTHYEADEDGVTAFFKDGTKARGKLLIGSDGLHSRVLDQLLGSTRDKPVLSSYVPLFGELDLPREQYEPLRQLAKSAIQVSGSGFRQMIGMLSMEEDRSSSRWFWALMPRRENPEPLSDWIQHASTHELYEYAVEFTKDYHPIVQNVIKYGGPKAIIQPQPKFQEFVPPERLPEGRVTVMGDAAHAMIPFRGAGANTALLDASDLAKLLIKAHTEGTDPSSIVGQYLATMIPRGREAVLSSRAAGDASGDDPAVHFNKFRRH